MARRRRRPQSDPRLAVGYVRVSKNRQELSPEAQRAALERWCLASGVVLVAVFEDRLCSVTPVGKRPGLDAALVELGTRGAGVLLVARRDRLARDPILTAVIERLLQDRGAVLRSAAGEGTDADDPTSILMRRILDAFAEYERLLIRYRTKCALGVKRSRGEALGAVPYGRRRAVDGVHLEEDPDELAIAREARSLRAQGRSLRAVGEALDARGLRPRGGGTWHPKTIVALLAAEAA
jgi:DNA invertase Pin-like site-specific DNA recombinase